MEAAVSELATYRNQTTVHQDLGCAPCIYDQKGQKELTTIYSGFLAVARDGDVPLLVTAPTWRTNQDMVRAAHAPSIINRDAVKFMRGVIRVLGKDMRRPVLLGGLLGPRGDAYRPEMSLDAKTAAEFHAWQAEELALAGVDYLMAATLPAVEEAVGLAQAMAKTEIPSIVSFVLNRGGRILDGSSLDQAIQRIDAECSPPPVGYMVNCSYPSFVHPQKETDRVLARLFGIQANASSQDHQELDRAQTIQADPLEDWGDRMLDLHRRWGLTVLGGCCGTGEQHLRYLVQKADAEGLAAKAVK
jgi:homocysteine S-methyltransferase